MAQTLSESISDSSVSLFGRFDREAAADSYHDAKQKEHACVCVCQRERERER